MCLQCGCPRFGDKAYLLVVCRVAPVRLLHQPVMSLGFALLKPSAAGLAFLPPPGVPALSAACLLLVFVPVLAPREGIHIAELQVEIACDVVRQVLVDVWKRLPHLLPSRADARLASLYHRPYLVASAKILGDNPGVRAHPLCLRLRQPTHPRMIRQSLDEVFHWLAPPVRHGPLRPLRTRTRWRDQLHVAARLPLSSPASRRTSPRRTD